MSEGDDATAVVLAGGRSTRFDDGDKAAARLGGKPLLARVVATARRAVDVPPVVAVADDDQRSAYAELLNEPVHFARDVPDRAGPVAGLASAAESSATEWLLVLGSDMPLVEDRAVEWLASRRGEGVDAVVPRDEGGRHPLHAWYRREAIDAALPSLSGDASLQDLLDQLSVDAPTAAEAPADVDLGRSVMNVNTVADLERARGLCRDR